MQSTEAPRMEQDQRTNWSGNLRYSTDRVVTPATVAETQEAVRGAERVRALGTRHAFNAIADTTGVQIATHRLCDIEISPEERTVRVGAGVRYGELAVALEAAGWALHNMASLPHISVGGAVATGTHGSGLGNGNLATAVVGLELVDGTGAVQQLTRAADPDRFNGAVVGLGALGVVTHLTLRLEPSYRMVQRVYQGLAIDVLEQNLEAVMGAGYSVSLFTDWAEGQIRQVWVKSRVEPGAERAAGPRELFGAPVATRPLHPLPEAPAEACTEQGDRAGAWFERLPHFRLEFQPSFGEELQSEYFVPFEAGYEAIRAVEALRAELQPVLYVSELRAMAADDLWLSGQYRRRSLGIHFTWRREWDAVQAVLPRVEAALQPFGARPHWGKVFTLDPAMVRERCPRFQDFAALRREFDPEGRMLNPFLERLLP